MMVRIDPSEVRQRATREQEERNKENQHLALITIVEAAETRAELLMFLDMITGTDLVATAEEDGYGEA